jgi:hypothetical protein
VAQDVDCLPFGFIASCEEAEGGAFWRHLSKATWIDCLEESVGIRRWSDGHFRTERVTDGQNEASTQQAQSLLAYHSLHIKSETFLIASISISIPRKP